MKYQTRNRERGVALFFSIFALLLLTAIGAALIFMASTETSVNSNYRQEQMAYFAAKAGVEEARARMMQSDPTSVACGAAGPVRPCPRWRCQLSAVRPESNHGGQSSLDLEPHGLLHHESRKWTGGPTLE
jgi:Tfp pilus assembly protein PilX